eukprot:scaffold1941_cov263-Pinguiococcus_pyrenoidosus.AAC.12
MLNSAGAGSLPQGKGGKSLRSAFPACRRCCTAADGQRHGAEPRGSESQSGAGGGFIVQGFGILAGGWADPWIKIQGPDRRALGARGSGEARGDWCHLLQEMQEARKVLGKLTKARAAALGAGRTLRRTDLLLT